MIRTEKRGSDNALEDYFLELVINKHIIDREIHDILGIIESSKLHLDYQIRLKKILFGENNLYLENWGTLGASLMDMIKTTNIRENKVHIYGIVLGIMLRVIEEVFDVDDEHFYDFMLSESREGIEHRLIILLKQVLNFIEEGLGEMLKNIHRLEQPIIDNHIRREFMIIRDSLLQYTHLILQSEEKHIHELKNQVDILVQSITKKKKNTQRYSDTKI